MNAEFNLPGGTTEAAFEASTGLAYARGVRDLFRGYHGPSVKMSEANQPGQDVFMRVYADPRDEFVDFELESAPLFFATKPASLVSVISGT
jgi:Phage major capsid protein E